MTADLLRRDPSVSNVQIVVEGEAPPVYADGEMLKIVFQNLLVNSAHAMQGQGRIDVAIAQVDGHCEIAFDRPRAGDPGRGSRQDLHRVLHHQVEGLRTGPGDGQTIWSRRTPAKSAWIARRPGAPRSRSGCRVSEANLAS